MRTSAFVLPSRTSLGPAAVPIRLEALDRRLEADPGGESYSRFVRSGETEHPKRDSSKPASPGLPVDEMVAPLPILAALLMGVNDHLLKGSGLLPSWLMGKLSDFCGLFFFPLFLSALIGLVLRRRTARLRLALSSATTAILFTLLQLHEPFARLYVSLHERLKPWERSFTVTMDPWDLTALPMVVLAFVYGIGRVRSRERGDQSRH